jgi:hypothetical protein
MYYMQEIIDKITTEMMEYVCDNLCRYPKECSEDELIDVCSECKMGKFVCCLLNTVNTDVITSEKMKSKETKHIDDLDLTVRTYNCLKRVGIDTVDDLCKMTEIEVASIRNFSQKCVDEINLKLFNIGKALRIDRTEVSCMNEIGIGDKVIMNDRYFVADKNKNVEFTVRSDPFDLCGTVCVMLENYRGGYALDGLSKVI